MADTSKSTKKSGRQVKRVTLSETLEVTPGDAVAEIVNQNTDRSPSPGFFAAGTVRYADITAFLRQLIMLLDAGTPLLRSLRALAKRSERLAVRGLINDIALFVEGGNALWQAFDRHPRYFDTVFVNLIKASEASGTLTTVLRQLVAYREEREILRKRVRGAMIYPILLVIACVAALFVITAFVVPVFADFFERADLAMPLGTKILIQASLLIRVGWWVPLLVLIAVILLYQFWYLRNPVRRVAADYVKIRLPIVGAIAHKNAIVEMCRTMSLLLRSGLSMMATLDLTRNAIHNRAVAESLQAMRDSVETGGGFEEPMRESGVIPHVVVDMFVTGEESGRVDQIADQIADIYEEEVKIAVSSLGDALQPIFTIVVGIGVLILFISLFLPMITMVDQLGLGSGI
jgi:type II secretory pathway component PulF